MALEVTMPTWAIATYVTQYIVADFNVMPVAPQIFDLKVLLSPFS